MDGACEGLTPICRVLADVWSVVFVMLFNLLPLRDGAAVLIFVIFIEPDPRPRGVPFFITDADAVAAG